MGKTRLKRFGVSYPISHFCTPPALIWRNSYCCLPFFLYVIHLGLLGFEKWWGRKQRSILSSQAASREYSQMPRYTRAHGPENYFVTYNKIGSTVPYPKTQRIKNQKERRNKRLLASHSTRHRCASISRALNCVFSLSLYHKLVFLPTCERAN